MFSLTLHLCQSREHHEAVQQDKHKVVVVPRQTVSISGNLWD